MGKIVVSVYGISSISQHTCMRAIKRMNGGTLELTTVDVTCKSANHDANVDEQG